MLLVSQPKAKPVGKKVTRKKKKVVIDSNEEVDRMYLLN